MARALPATWRAAPLTLAVVVLALVAGATCDTPTATPADAKTTLAPAVINIATEAPKSNGSASTVKPHGAEPAPTIAVALAPTGAPSATTSKPTAAAAAAPAAPATTPAAAPDATPGQRVAQYFEPVCTYLERLKPKQMFKIQAQMKQFVEKTAGKMSMCFLQHYSMDPNLAPVSKAQLEAICGSRALEPSAKNSFAAFLACTAANYDAALDAELARINRARAAHTPNRAAGANDTLASLAHDDDELSLISEVVDKVMADSKEGKAPPKPDIKVIEAPAGPGGQSPTAAPGAKAPFAELMANKTILHDPNTMILFVDESNSTAAAAAAAAAKSTAKPPLFVHSTPAPIKVTLITHPSNATSSAKPTSLADKIVAAATKTTAAPAPGVVITNSTTVVTVAPTTTGKPASTTAAPAKAASTTPPPPPPPSPPAPKSTTTTKPPAPPATSTSARPLKTLEKVLDRQDSERSKLDSKLKKEREQLLKAAQKDDSEAKKAIKALQAQRAQAHGSPADARMHQIEHERQMSIDPVGHTTKHKEYELKKAAKSTTTTTSTTAKPKE